LEERNSFERISPVGISLARRDRFPVRGFEAPVPLIVLVGFPNLEFRVARAHVCFLPLEMEEGESILVKVEGTAVIDRRRDQSLAA
jgi:hypothetical protein